MKLLILLFILKLIGNELILENFIIKTQCDYEDLTVCVNHNRKPPRGYFQKLLY